MADAGFEVLEIRYCILPDVTRVHVYGQGVPGTDYPRCIEGWYSRDFPADTPGDRIMRLMFGLDGGEHFLSWDRLAPDPGEDLKEALREVLDRYVMDIGSAQARIAQLQGGKYTMIWEQTLRWLGDVKEKYLQRPSTS